MKIIQEKRVPTTYLLFFITITELITSNSMKWSVVLWCLYGIYVCARDDV